MPPTSHRNTGNVVGLLFSFCKIVNGGEYSGNEFRDLQTPIAEQRFDQKGIAKLLPQGVNRLGHAISKQNEIVTLLLR